MPEKGGSFVPVHQWRLGLLTALVLVGMVVVWSIDGCTIKTFVQSWQFKQDYITLKVNSFANINQAHQNFSHSLRNLTLNPTLNTTHFPFLNVNSSLETKKSSLNWVSAELENNFTANLLSRWLAEGGEPCKDSKTVEIKIPGLEKDDLVELSAGEIHYFMFQALDESGNVQAVDSGWDCLKNRWIFFWGDSNHVDTIRNMLNFVLGLPEIKSVPRRFDMNFSNPKDRSQTVRITSIFNGHWNGTQNYLGLDSLKDEGFRNLLKKYFSEDTVPDTIIMNSGLHDGVHWSNIRAFSRGAEYAASFWKDIMESVRRRGLVVPQIIFRSTIATGGYARLLAFNPNKMEAFNGVFLEKLKQAGLVSSVIDNFDMTFSWHFDNRCNDGVHYGRAPLKMKWRDGEIGHQYFVDLMLCHVLLNVLCAR
ncbi:hypothetical protein GOBAR_AA03472 [Gossypium barbadense]|uniref:Uncharacterized protein n=1 Tax=Gossypium barbadense TaxID=3634 RepID=A0A2P5YND3_GOSBA|nr:hypothetical protein GOBAR_AA03472 [Gossypium barbadense]